MINVIQTLKNLNKEFPRFQLDTLIKIVECVVEKSEYPVWSSPTIDTKWYNNSVTCADPASIICTYSAQNKAEDPGFVYSTTTKNHAVDKTSSKQNITTEEFDEPGFLDELKKML
jgi:hypothetical protein